MNVIQMPIRKLTNDPMVCAECGIEKACDCHAPYITASERAAAGIANAEPGESNRSIAARTRVAPATVDRLRASNEAERHPTNEEIRAKALAAIAANPDKSNREIAHEIGVCKDTVRRARQSLVENTEQPMITNNDIVEPAATRPPQGCRVKVKTGKPLMEAVQDGLDFIEQGIPFHEIPPKIGLSQLTFATMRDIMMLLRRNDLSERDATTVRQALAEIETTGFINEPAETIKPIAQRIWGIKGHRGGADKKRIEHFDTVIHLIFVTCANSIELDIPYITAAKANEAVSTLREAQTALTALCQRIMTEVPK